MSEQEILKTIGNNIKYYLDRYEISQAELAKRLGVSTTTVSNWVNGLKAPRMPKVDMMCSIFNCKRSDLMEERTANEQEGYYIDPRTAEIAQEIKDSRELSALFDVGRDMSPEDLQTVYQMAVALKKKERG